MTVPEALHSCPTGDMMQVLQIPYVQKNPYQSCLIQALNRNGVKAAGGDVAFGRKGGPLPVIDAVSKEGKVDVLHLHWAHRWFGVPPQKADIPLIREKIFFQSLRLITELFWLKLKGIKIIWTVHNVLGHSSLNANQELLFRRVLSRLCDHLVVHCPVARSKIIDAYRLSTDINIAVIPHGHYIDCYENEITEDEARRSLSVSSNETAFLFLGQIRPYKGIFELIDAFKRLETSRAILIIAGGGCGNNRIEQKVQDLCKMEGQIHLVLQFVPDKQVQLYMNAADVVVLPFKKVLTSGSLMLALSFGRPIIAPRLGCVSDVLEGTNNLMYDPDIPGGLYRAMQAALQMNLDYIGQKNLQHVRQFDWDAIAQTTHRVYEQCLPG
jgi:glycosyltransferase involved in cell wall biosynthesis